MLAASLLACASAACGQQVQPMVVGDQPLPPVLRTGTPVVLKTLHGMTTKGKHLNVGDRFSLEVAEPLLVNGRIVIPVGTNAVGEITSVRNKGMWGTSGNIEARLLYISTNDRRIRLTGTVGDKGIKAGGGAIATSAIVFLPAGFFMTGTSAVIPPGTTVHGIIDEDVPIAFAPPPAPLVAPAPAATAIGASAAVGMPALTTNAASTSN
jgi:hypothetical protein